MAILRFQPNIPLEVTLRSLEPQTVESKFGGNQHLFTAEEGIFYVSEPVGAILYDQFHKLGVVPGQAVEITKGVNGSGPGAKTKWIVNMSSDATEPAAPPEPPSDLERRLADSIALVEARKQPQPARVAVQPAAVAPAWTASLVAQSNALIDAYSQVMTHAAQYPNVRGDDVKSIFLSIFINVSKSGVKNVA